MKKDIRLDVFFYWLFAPNSLLDLKGGSWQQAGGQLQPPWPFRRKASPTGELRMVSVLPFVKAVSLPSLAFSNHLCYIFLK